MSNLTYLQAQDEMLAMVKAAWDTTAYADRMFYEGVPFDRPTDQSPWAVTYIRHASGAQRTLGGSSGSLFERLGVTIINIFIPTGKGLSESYPLAKVLSDAFEGKSSPGGIWFRNVRIVEIGSEGDFHQTNFLADFTYTETK